ncbi:hypothetical protein HPB51_005974 [Rhipicephalus microplus]|uniref:Uncharacterized protein n=1 Tax=Rhipicephalus microplus TaxID=6941 RepID=A0A9J6E6L4_RHIMP|nr:hypothetical protein HPB51_005974 [Rhipicephalus microplus]
MSRVAAFEGVVDSRGKGDGGCALDEGSPDGICWPVEGAAAVLFPNQRLRKHNWCAVRRFNFEAREFNLRLLSLCHERQGVFFVNHRIDALPPWIVLAADGLHPSFARVSILAWNIYNLFLDLRRPCITNWLDQAPQPEAEAYVLRETPSYSQALRRDPPNATCQGSEGSQKEHELAKTEDRDFECQQLLVTEAGLGLIVLIHGIGCRSAERQNARPVVRSTHEEAMHHEAMVEREQLYKSEAESNVWIAADRKRNADRTHFLHETRSAGKMEPTLAPLKPVS